MNIALRRVLGILDLGGSFLGFTLGLTTLLQQTTVAVMIVEIPFLALYCWGIWCGVQMLENNPRAIPANLWFWALQIPYLMSPIIGYLFTSGAFLLVTYQPETSATSFTAKFGSQFQASLLQGQSFQIGINFLALAVCVILMVNKRHVEKSGVERSEVAAGLNS